MAKLRGLYASRQVRRIRGSDKGPVHTTILGDYNVDQGLQWQRQKQRRTAAPSAFRRC
jgi:hypothetical protein